LRRSDSSFRYFGAASDDGDLDRLYRQYRDYVRRYIGRAFGPGPPDPEDVVHAAFEKFAMIEDRTAIANPQAFLVKSARNYVLDQRRRQKVRADFADMSVVAGSDRDELDAERVLSAKERWAILERTIRTMDARHQQVLVMNRIHGLSYAEIARRTSMSATLVKMLTAEALVMCQRALREADGG
jgi:RNA polymerase sigma factor (sigma-70 family)